MNSPIKWMGGKNQSLSKLLPLIPNHYTYAEPFIGAGWVLFAKEKASVEVLNDVNGDLINFYNVIKNNTDEFIDRMDLTLKSVETFLNYRETMSDKSLSDTERAFRFYYVNQNAFGGMIRYNKQGKCNSACMRHPRRKMGGSYWVLDKIYDAHERLKDVNIECDTYEKIISKYDTKDTFFFLDPPYECASGKYNNGDTFDYNELLNNVKSIKGKFMLTLNGEFEQLFKDFNIIHNDVHWSIGCTSDSTKKYDEIIVMNY